MVWSRVFCFIVTPGETPGLPGCAPETVAIPGSKLFRGDLVVFVAELTVDLQGLVLGFDVINLVLTQGDEGALYPFVAAVACEHGQRAF